MASAPRDLFDDVFEPDAQLPRGARRLLSRLAALAVPTNDEYYGTNGADAESGDSGAAVHATLYDIALNDRVSTARTLELTATLKDADRTTPSAGQERRERSRLLVYSSLAVGAAVLLFLTVWFLSLERGG
jgi:hypothetical protein